MAFAVSALFLGAGFVEFGVALEVRAADEGDRSIGILLLALMGGFGAFLWVKTFEALRSRFRANLGLLVTPESIVIHTDARLLRIPWRAVTAFRAHWVQMSDDWIEIDDLVRNFLTIEVYQRLVTRKPRPLDVSRMACQPELALAVLRFYLASPDARAELRSRAAAERVASLSNAK